MRISPSSPNFHAVSTRPMDAAASSARQVDHATFGYRMDGKKVDNLRNFSFPDSKKWAVMDSNHRRLRQLSYSQPHLATLVTAQCSLSSFEPLVGFEPTTPRLQITCSGQLS